MLDRDPGDERPSGLSRGEALLRGDQFDPWAQSLAVEQFTRTFFFSAVVLPI